MADESQDLGSIGNATFGVTADFSGVTEAIKTSEAELAERFAQLGATVGDSLSNSLRKGGDDAAQGLRPAADATRSLHEEGVKFVGVGQAMQDQLQTLATAFSIGTLINKAAEALVEFGKDAFSSGSQMTDMALKTGLSTDMLQKLQFIGAQTGVELGSLSNASFMLGSRLAQGDTSVTHAVDRLQLSFADLISASPDEQMEMVARALQNVGTESERNRLILDLYGRAGRSIVPALAEDWETLSVGMVRASEEQLKELDKANDAWQRLGLTVKTLTSVSMADATSLIDKFAQSVGLSSTVVTTHGKEVSTLSVLLGSLGPILESVTGQMSTQDAAAAAAKEAARQLGVEVAALTDDQKQYIESQVEAGASNDFLTRAVGASSKAVLQYAESIRSKVNPEQAAAKIGAEALKEANTRLTPTVQAAAEAMLNAGFSASDVFKRLKDGGAITEDSRIQIDKLGDAHKAAAEAAKKAADEVEKAEKKRQQAIADSTASIAGLNAELVQQVLNLEQQKLKESEVALVTGLTEQQVRLVIKAQEDREKSEQAAADEQRKRHEDDVKRSDEEMSRFFKDLDEKNALERQAAELHDQRTMSSTDFQVAQIERWRKVEQDKVDQSVAGWQQHWKAIDDVADEKLAMITEHSTAMTDALIADGELFQEQWSGVFATLGSGLQDLFLGAGGVGAALDKMFKDLAQGASQAIMIGLQRGGVLGSIEGGVTRLFGTGSFGAAVSGLIGGVMTAGISAAIGFGISSLSAAFKSPSLQYGSKAILMAIGQYWGQDVGAGVLKGIDTSMKQNKGNATIAEALNLKGLIADALSQPNVNRLQVMQTGADRLNMAMYLAYYGFLNAQQASQVLDDNFTQLAQGGMNSFGLVSKAIHETISAAESLHLDSKAVNEFVSQQTQSTLGSLANVAQNMTIKTQEGAKFLSAVVEVAYQQVVAKTHSVREAVSEVTPVVEALRAQFDRTGMDTEGAMAAMSARFDVLKDDKIGGAVGAMEDFGNAMISAFNAGILGSDGFSVLQKELNAQVQDVSQTLSDQGKDASLVYQFAKVPLEQILSLHEQTGWAIEAETQALIDQAGAQGVIATQAKSVQEVLQTGFGDLVDAIKKLPEEFQAFIDKTHEAAAAMTSVGDAAGQIAVPDLTSAALGMMTPGSLLDQGSLSTGYGAADALGVANIYLDGDLLTQAVLRRTGSQLAMQGLGV